MKLKFWVTLTLPFCILFIFNTALAAKGDIYIVKVADAISPGTAEFINSSIEKAEKEEAACIIIELDTPGGLAESMRLIIQDILGSQVPVVVYVSPSGARAASAGVMITMAADIAAMAPSTNIGCRRQGYQRQDVGKSDQRHGRACQECCRRPWAKCEMGGAGHPGKCFGDRN